MIICPFWSRVAQVGDIHLALCSPQDLEMQRAAGYGEPEGMERAENCMFGFTIRLARRFPIILMWSEPGFTNLRRIGTTFDPKKLDAAWAKVLAWAQEQATWKTKEEP
jgi:hypothetical protein